MKNNRPNSFLIISQLKTKFNKLDNNRRLEFVNHMFFYLDKLLEEQENATSD